MEKKTVVGLNKAEVKELGEELGVFVEIDSDYISLEYQDEDKEDEELQKGKSFEDMSDDIAMELISLVNKKYNTDIPTDALLFCAKDIGFYIGIMY